MTITLKMKKLVLCMVPRHHSLLTITHHFIAEENWWFQNQNQFLVPTWSVINISTHSLQKVNDFANFTTCTYTHIHGILWEVTSIVYNFSYLGSSSSSFIHLQNTKLTNTNSFRFPVHQCDLSFIFVLFQSSKVVTTKCQVRTPQYKTSLKIRTKMC